MLLKKIPAWVVYPIGLIPAVWYFVAAFRNELGADPLHVLEHALGEWALRMLILGLCITPIMKSAKINLIKFRRAIGLVAFSYVVLHMIVYVVLDRQFDADAIIKDIFKRPYITIGMAAFIMLVPLAITSNNASIRKLGAVMWGKIHLLVYPAAIGGGLHYVLLKKTWEPEPIIYLLIIIALIALRAKYKFLDVKKRVTQQKTS